MKRRTFLSLWLAALFAGCRDPGAPPPFTPDHDARDPMPLVIPVRAPPQSPFDHFASPTGDDTNPGTKSQPWSLSAIWNQANNYTNLGLLPGTYYGGQTGGTFTRIGDYINANANRWGTLPSWGTAAKPVLIGSCDVNGQPSPRTAIIDCSDSVNGLPPIRNGAIFVSGTSSSYWILDGLVIQKYSNSAISGSGASNCIIRNCLLQDSVAPNESYNPSGISFNGNTGLGANGNYIYNTKITNSQTLGPISLSLSGITNAGATMSAPWPYDNSQLSTGILFTLKFTDTGQSLIQNVVANNGSNQIWFTSLLHVTANLAIGATSATLSAPFSGTTGTYQCFFGSTPQTDQRAITLTNGSTAISWTGGLTATTNTILRYAGGVTVTGTPSGAATIFMNPPQSPTTPVENFYPYGQWMFYFEGVGKTSPLVMESCTTTKGGWSGCKTNIGVVQLKRCYFEVWNFGVSPPPGTGTYWAFNGLNTIAGANAGADHCIFIGWVQCFNEGQVADLEANSGTITFTHNTLYLPSASTGLNASFANCPAQATPGTLVFRNNLMARPGCGYLHFTGSVAGGTHLGTINSDYNGFCNSTPFHTANTPTGVPDSPTGTTVYNFTGWNTLTGQDGHSKDLSSETTAIMFATTPAQANPASFAIAPGSGAHGASETGTDLGAIDGTVGLNGVAVGCNF